MSESEDSSNDSSSSDEEIEIDYQKLAQRCLTEGQKSCEEILDESLQDNKEEYANYLMFLKEKEDIGQLLKISHAKEDNILDFFKTHLILASIYNKDLVTQILFHMRLYCNNKSDEERKRFFSHVVHFKDSKNKVALAYANENGDIVNCVELIKIEQEIHSKPKNGLNCIKLSVHSGPLLPWIINTYENRYSQPSPFTAFFLVFFELFLLSYMLSGYDFTSDIMLLKEYYELKDYSNAQIDQDLYEGTSLSEICQFRYPYGEIRRGFLIAMWMTIAVLISSIVMYLFNVLLSVRENEASISVKILEFILWPGYHMWRKYQYYKSERKAEYKDDVAKKDNTWKLVRIVEEGVENMFQMMLSVWLLFYLIPYLSSWKFSEVLSKSGDGLLNLLTFGIHHASFIEKFLGKLLMTIVFLTLSITIVKFDKAGLGITHKLKYCIPTLLSVFFQIASRIIAFLILVGFEVDRDEFAIAKYFGFLVIHWSFTFAIVSSFGKKLSDQQKEDERKSKVSRAWKWFSYIICVLSSTITLQSIPDQTIGKSNEHTFLSQSFFQVLLLFENILLSFIPMTLYDQYPILDCFPSREFVYYLPAYMLGLWLLSNFFQVLHYRWSHPWKSINGPRFVIEDSTYTCSLFATYCQKEKVQMLSLTMKKDKICGMTCLKCTCKGEDYNEDFILKQEDLFDEKNQNRLRKQSDVRTSQPKQEEPKLPIPASSSNKKSDENKNLKSDEEKQESGIVEKPENADTNDIVSVDKETKQKTDDGSNQPNSANLDSIEVVDETNKMRQEGPEDSTQQPKESKNARKRWVEDEENEKRPAATKNDSKKERWQADEQDSQRSKQDEQNNAKKKWNRE